MSPLPLDLPAAAPYACAPASQPAARGPTAPHAITPRDTQTYFTEVAHDYRAWSPAYNMHFGYWRAGLNPLRRAGEDRWMKSAPVFQAVLGDADWQRLDAVVRRHYSLRPFSDDQMTVRGHMDEVWHAPWAALLMPAGRLFGALVPHQGRDVPIDVNYRCRLNDAALCWDRRFHFPGKPVFHFRSHMEVADAARHEVIEYVRFGLGLRLRVTAEQGALVFRDTGYVWRIGSFFKLPIPLHWLLGRAYVEERPVPGDTGAFTMKMTIRHPWWGELFRYSGRFRLD